MTRASYVQTLPARPYCVASLGHRLLIRDAAKAAQFPMLQHNSPLIWRWMVFDIDGEDAYDRAEDRGCPPPTFIALNRANGHAHLGYLLETPVSAFENSSRKPMRFYEDVERGLTHKLGADLAYPAFLSKNPVSETWLADWQAKVPYRLDTLNDYLDKADKRKPSKQELSATGRNIALFDALRDIAYKQWLNYRKAGKCRDDFEFMLRTAGNGINNTFTPSLTHVEVKGIARSVAKWVWGKFSLEKFSAIQSARGKKRWLKTTTLTEAKPWKAEGISRASWYRARETIAISG